MMNEKITAIIDFGDMPFDSKPTVTLTGILPVNLAMSAPGVDERMDEVYEYLKQHLNVPLPLNSINFSVSDNGVPFFSVMRRENPDEFLATIFTSGVMEVGIK